MKISANIITFNEEKNIEKCIKSIQAVADEIIIVDSYSTDKTEEIANSFNKTRWIQHKFEGYGQQKNIALRQSQFDYILSIDADETLSLELQEEIIHLKESSIEKSKAFYIPRLNNYCGKWIKHGGWYPDRKIRLWNKNFGQWTPDLHEKVILKNGVEPAKLKGDILHYTTDSISTHIDQVNKFSEIAAAQLLKSKKKQNAIFKMLFDPPFMFIKKYFFQLGFLDGFYGFAIAIISAHAKFLKYAKYYQKSKFKQ
ncbi:glycosyltransferase family 2 protein [Marivirga arenosa]|uniref:Glycosyltransferase family 2 protein n=1 Tax=Marivirga arenosa TaxID=3059076 RepID=A0AA49JC69_9BACT|nr:glycosyltransferase family 2 protein [Marivirga sp. BKB1-2]WKK79086.2 glycosyltransferase family 2 protein [Marivirga sp. BKB1-2]